MSNLNRRQFLQTTATAAAGAVLPEVAWAQRAGTGINITDILASKPLDDQYGQPFKPQTTLKGRPYLLVQGFLHCPGQCLRIRTNLGIVRRALEEQASALEAARKPKEAEALRNIPIVWVNVNPDDDRKEPEACLIEAYKRGIWQDAGHGKRFPADEESRIALAKQAFAEGKNQVEAAIADKKEPDLSKRLVHVVFPQSQQAVIDLQDKMGAYFNKADPQSHGSRISLIDGGGKIVAAPSGLVTDKKQQADLANLITSKAVDAVQGIAR